MGLVLILMLTPSVTPRHGSLIVMHELKTPTTTTTRRHKYLHQSTELVSNHMAQEMVRERRGGEREREKERESEREE